MTPGDSRGGVLADLVLLGATAIWGASFVIVRLALGEVAPLHFVALRFTVASLVLAPFVAWRSEASELRSIRAGAIVGFWCVLGFALQTIGLATTEPARAAFLTGLTVVLVPVLMVTLHRRLPSVASAVGVLLATVGLLLLTGPGRGGFSRGDASILLGAAAFALQILAVHRYAKEIGAFVLLFWELVASALLAWPMTLLMESTRIPRTSTAWAGILAAAIFSTVLCLGAQNWAQRITPPTRAAVILTAEPVFAAFVSYWTTGERLGGSALAGCALILSGMLASELLPRSSPRSIA